MRASWVFLLAGLLCALVVLFRHPIRFDGVALLAMLFFALAVGARFLAEARDGNR